MQKPKIMLIALMHCSLIACAPAKKAPTIPSAAGTPGMKAESVSSTHVALTVFSELSHIERAVKPMAGNSTTSFPVDIPGGTECRSVGTSSIGQWETKWNCALASTTPGKKEIQGTERLNFDTAKNSLIYDAGFETRNFNDVEARSQAHTLVTSRRIQIIFDRGSTTESGRARLIMTSSATVNGTTGILGSNWRIGVEGTLVRTGSTWTLETGSKIFYDGALYGLDGERKTVWSVGQYSFVSNSITTLTGLGDATCTKPEGSWKLHAVGAGENFDTEVETTAKSGVHAGNATLGWPSSLCGMP